MKPQKKNEIKTTDKVEQKEIRVKLKNKTWWKRNHYFFELVCYFIHNCSNIYFVECYPQEI